MMLWNKIEIDNLNIVLKDNNPYYINITNNVKINVIVNSMVSATLIILGNNNYDLNITLLDKAKLQVNSLNKDNNVNVLINLNEESNITYNHSVLSQNNSENKFQINHLKNNSSSLLNNNGINANNGKLYFTIDGVIPKNLVNISCNQSSKIINFNKGDSKIIPNLIIDSNDIIANHSAYIGEIGEEELFYMQSRGISDEIIKKLIYKAVLLGKMDLFLEEFNKIINEWW